MRPDDGRLPALKSAGGNPYRVAMFCVSRCTGVMKTTIKKVKSISYDVDKLGGIQLLGNDVLTAVARGEMDLNQIAINHLAGRGLDENGAWIGFDKAKERFLEK